MTEFKQAIVLRTDLGMGKGKMVAQACHASITAWESARQKDSQSASEWLESGEKKIVMKVSSEMDLKKLHEKAKRLKIPCAIIRDAGLTQIPQGSVTALAIGPWESQKIDEVTGDLKLL